MTRQLNSITTPKSSGIPKKRVAVDTAKENSNRRATGHHIEPPEIVNPRLKRYFLDAKEDYT